MIEKPVYIITFNNSSDSISLYNYLKSENLNIYIIQTPCNLSAECARSIQISEYDLYKTVDVIKSHNIDVKSIHLKYVDESIRRYVYEEIMF